MQKVLKKGKRSNRKERLLAYEEFLNRERGASRIELIQMLIPLGLAAVEAELQSEVIQIAGGLIPVICLGLRDGVIMTVRFIWETRRCRSRFPVFGMC